MNLSYMMNLYFHASRIFISCQVSSVSLTLSSSFSSKIHLHPRDSVVRFDHVPKNDCQDGRIGTCSCSAGETKFYKILNFRNQRIEELHWKASKVPGSFTVNLMQETRRNRRKSFSESFRKHYIIVCNWNVMKWWVFHNSLLAYETSMCNWCWNFERHSPRLEKNTFVFPTWTFIMIWFCAFWTIERSERLEETENVCRQGAPLRLPRSTPVLVENSTNMQKWMKMVEVQISGLQLLECHRSHSPPTARHNRHVTNYRRYKGFFDCRAYLISSSYHLISGWS